MMAIILKIAAIAVFLWFWALLLTWQPPGPELIIIQELEQRSPVEWERLLDG